MERKSVCVNVDDLELISIGWVKKSQPAAAEQRRALASGLANPSYLHVVLVVQFLPRRGSTQTKAQKQDQDGYLRVSGSMLA